MARRSSAPPPPNWDGTCTAKSKQSGKPCKQKAVPPTTKCRFHGGKSLRGPAHPNWKHGEDSMMARAVPKRMREIFLKAEGMQDIVTLRGELSLLVAREIDLLEQLNEGGSTEFWAEARREAELVKLGQGNPTVLAEIVSRGADEWDVWQDILQTVELRRKLADTERKKIEMAQVSMSREEVGALIAGLVRIVGELVSDRKILSEVHSRVLAMMPGAAQNQDEVIGEVVDDRALVAVNEE